MRVLVTGATGFVGRWLIRELEAAGHEAIAAPGSRELDITDAAAVRDFVVRAAPDAIAHLAAVSYGPEAASDPERAMAVNAGGTRALVDATIRLERGARLLIASSSEVYGRPDPADLPLREDAPLRGDQPYARSKLAAERVVADDGLHLGVPMVVTRAFNHTGPGQRQDFVAPALAARIHEAKRTGRREVAVGNLDVRRDIGDVRDVVRAYRLLLERLVAGDQAVVDLAFNVATGQSTSIRELFGILAAAAGADVVPVVDTSLVRIDDAPEIVGDASRLRAATGWRPVIPLETTLSDLMRSVDAAAGSARDGDG